MSRVIIPERQAIFLQITTDFLWMQQIIKLRTHKIGCNLVKFKHLAITWCGIWELFLTRTLSSVQDFGILCETAHIFMNEPKQRQQCYFTTWGDLCLKVWHKEWQVVHIPYRKTGFLIHFLCSNLVLYFYLFYSWI